MLSQGCYWPQISYLPDHILPSPDPLRLVPAKSLVEIQVDPVEQQMLILGLGFSPVPGDLGMLELSTAAPLQNKVNCFFF